ncbi:MAG: hypothetical protein H6765_01110 [Candidatus Peribacteria bacterium]|nr:MAG: hypothetical protein H6765_01110 [Candidatus Peribacteria bacterium]
MTDAKILASLILVISDGYGAGFALWYMPTVLADTSTGVASFVVDDEDASVLGKRFGKSFAGEFGKRICTLFAHIYEKNLFITLLKLLVVHAVTVLIVF